MSMSERQAGKLANLIHDKFRNGFITRQEAVRGLSLLEPHLSMTQINKFSDLLATKGN